ncbi:DUF1501 domain-containing protein [Hymenobacter terrenus]|uniref:DUF1501 domain-containing protein n=1 Tax=Hymenobacter terrenus TaxID=1629124 RepID=UPI000619915E|nr:DUF1501 domain-containing protein [Hymenobacter terrenus]
MKRRHFLQTTAAATVLPTLLGGFSIQAYGYSPKLAALTNAATASDKVLVLIELNGGNDGCNTVISLDQYSALMAARANITIPESLVLRLTPATGLHPAMTGLKSLYDNQKLGIVQSMGFPNPDYSHFRSAEIINSGSDSNVVLNTGWAGRYLDGEYTDYPNGYPSAQNPDPLALTIGGTVSSSLQGPKLNMGMAITDATSFNQLVTGDVEPAPATPYGYELTFIRRMKSQSQVYGPAIKQAAAKAANLSPLYPAAGQNTLADQLKIVAQLVAGGLQTRMYVCNLGGFDTHLAQTLGGTNTTGGHAELLNKLSIAIAAFQDDLSRLGVQDRVVGMTYSEFGRRVRSNAGLGTDHGAAAPMFVFGSKVNPIIHGTNPILPTNAGVDDNVAMQFDFRSIYSSVLKDWFQVPQSTLDGIFGRSFPYVPVLLQSTASRSPLAKTSPNEAHRDVQNFSVYPNPVHDQATVTFEADGGHVQVLVFNHIGREVLRVVDRTLERGQQQLKLDVSTLAPGPYYCHVQEGSHVSARLLTVVK